MKAIDRQKCKQRGILYISKGGVVHLFDVRIGRQLARRRRPVAQPVRVLSSSKDSSPSSTNNSPAEFLSGAASTAVVVEAPTSRRLRIVALRSAVPMVGFGFMDNLVMIQAGEAIDMSIEVTFGLSTMTAAGFGQCVSDVAGFTCVPNGRIRIVSQCRYTIQSWSCEFKMIVSRSWACKIQIKK